jgi:microsomal dipeptidase-like Zn-dependent dipeptidase
MEAIAEPVSAADARTAIENMATVDVYSHAGGVIGLRRVNSDDPFSPVADPMREGGMAMGMARMVDAIGIDHVALGSDMRGLFGPSTFSFYRDLPLLAQALLARGFQVPEVRKVLGGNYVPYLPQVFRTQANCLSSFRHS